MAWQEATLDTIARLQAIWQITPLERTTRFMLMREAREIALSLATDKQRFWNIYINTLRILVAAESTNPVTKKIFEAEKPTGGREIVERQCPATRDGDQCLLREGHGGKHDYGG